jgi:hypothetical protein
MSDRIDGSVRMSRDDPGVASSDRLRDDPGLDARHAVLFEPVQVGPKTLRFYQVPHASGFGSDRPRSQAAFREVNAEGGWGGVCLDYAPISHDTDEIPEVGANRVLVVRRPGRAPVT